MSGEVWLGVVDACPLADECLVCKSTTDLARETVDTPVGVCCITRCEDCADDEKLPNLSWPQAVILSGEHAGHLGIDVDQMAAAMEAEREEAEA